MRNKLKNKLINKKSQSQQAAGYSLCLQLGTTKNNRSKLRSIRSNWSNESIMILGILFIAMIFLCVFLYFQLTDYFSIIEKREIFAKIIVGEQYGFDINGTALIFGIVLPGTDATKEIFLDNKYGRDVRVKIFVKGDIGKFMRVSENDFVLGRNKTENVSFFVNIPKNTDYGKYDGIVVIQYRAKN